MVCLGNRDHSAIFEILFLRYSTLLQLFPPFFLLTHLSIFCSFVSVILLLIPSSIFFFNFSFCIVHYLFFISSKFMLKISFIFSNLCLHSIYLCLQFLSKFWSIFTIIILKYFSGKLPIFSSFVWSCEFLPCFFSVACLSVLPFCLIYSVCDLFFCRLQGHNSYLWSLSPLGGIVVSCEDFSWGGLVSVFWSVELDLSKRKCCIQWCVIGWWVTVCKLAMTELPVC